MVQNVGARPRPLRLLLAAAAAAALAGCAALPRSGPTGPELTAEDDGGRIDGLVVDVDAAIVAATLRRPTPGFPPAWRGAATVDPARLAVDDVIEIRIWESDGGVLDEGPGPATLQDVRIDGRGDVYVPYVGEIDAAGLTVAEFRRRLRDALGAITAAPEVDVRVVSPDGRRFSIQGSVAQPGVYAAGPRSARLLEALATAGGAPLPAEQAEVALWRDGALATETLAAIYADSRLDIAVMPGDTILVTPLRQRFVALGATGAQAEIAFPTRNLSLLSALAAARGLRDNDADPENVFVLRFEDRAVADALLAGPPLDALPAGARRAVVFRFDLSEPEGLFLARDFAMRDGDALYVANAPATELRKFVQIFTSVLSPIQSTASVGAL